MEWWLSILLPVLWGTGIAANLWSVNYFPKKSRFYRVVDPSSNPDESGRQLVVKGCHHVLDRRIGLFNHCSLAIGEGVYLPGAKVVEASRLSFAVDVVWIDRNKNIIKIDEYVEGRSFAPQEKFTSAIVVGAGSIASQFQCTLGSKIELIELQPTANTSLLGGSD